MEPKNDETNDIDSAVSLKIWKIFLVKLQPRRIWSSFKGLTRFL